MTSAETKLIAFAIFLLFLLAFSITCCEYQRVVVIPAAMAEKGFCWDSQRHSYYPCEAK